MSEARRGRAHGDSVEVLPVRVDGARDGGGKEGVVNDTITDCGDGLPFEGFPTLKKLDKTGDCLWVVNYVP